MTTTLLLEPESGLPGILVVEDEPAVANLISRALSDEGFVVRKAPDGGAGLDLARTGRYELVVLDLLLPDLDGFEVLRGIIDALPEQRVLVLSVLSAVEAKVRCLETGAVDYLTKPFSLVELVARVRAHIRQPAAPASGRYLRGGRVVADLVRRTADVGSGPVSLSEREFALLEQLLGAAGRVLSRDQLLDTVWKDSSGISRNVVDVYVARLRSKLGADLIETIRSAGYRLDLR